MPGTSVQPLHGIVKEEPFSILPYIDEKPCLDAMNTNFVSNRQRSKFQPGSSNGTAEVDDIEYYTISGMKPYFDLILAKTHVNHPFRVNLPGRMVPELPFELVPMVLISCGKRWETFYHGDGSAKRFGWKRFVMDNDLKKGDCCFFELMECSKTNIVFKVIILRGSLPFGGGPEDGDTPETAIFIE
ncbi:B3 domain-containing protein Os04g0386900-like [Coffea eugenioides]|uniref:B3 domain-containing protein Os04g0386900-like n=1 Tax=Coffea arabica TaxID=13443 RepID=A0A6P6TNW6_COFAR|nr:B3 domain-containing protein Os04g0386900-like [Coffea arabica]XP_027183437.1 B3 domain-containing protein Os04g0386900-like [Coffea eugenioides]